MNFNVYQTRATYITKYPNFTVALFSNILNLTNPIKFVVKSPNDDVVTCIYKKVQVSSDASKSGETSNETIVEEDSAENEEQPSDELTDDTTTSLSADDIA